MIGEHAEELSKAAMAVLRRHAPSLFSPEGQLLPFAVAQAKVRPGGTGSAASPLRDGRPRGNPTLWVEVGDEPKPHGNDRAPR